MRLQNYNMRKVIAFGTFDYVHAGHIHFLKQAKRLGDHLTVVIARDLTAKKVKGKKPSQTDTARLAVVKSLRIVDDVLLGSKEDVYAPLKKVRPNVVALGYDQTSFTEQLPAKIKGLGLKTKIVRIKSYKPKLQKSSIHKSKQEKNDAKVFLVPLAIIVHNGKVFLQQRNDPGTANHLKWELPGGSVEWGETPEQCLIRETKEECGFVVEPIQLLPKIFTNYRTYEWGRVQIVLMPYLCKPIKMRMKLSDREVKRAGWFTFAQARKKKSLPNANDMLDIAEKILNL